MFQGVRRSFSFGMFDPKPLSTFRPELPSGQAAPRPCRAADHRSRTRCPLSILSTTGCALRRRRRHGVSDSGASCAAFGCVSWGWPRAFLFSAVGQTPKQGGRAEPGAGRCRREAPQAYGRDPRLHRDPGGDDPGGDDPGGGDPGSDDRRDRRPTCLFRHPRTRASRMRTRGSWTFLSVPSSSSTTSRRGRSSASSQRGRHPTG